MQPHRTHDAPGGIRTRTWADFKFSSRPSERARQVDPVLAMLYGYTNIRFACWFRRWPRQSIPPTLITGSLRTCQLPMDRESRALLALWPAVEMRPVALGVAPTLPDGPNMPAALGVDGEVQCPRVILDGAARAAGTEFVDRDVHRLAALVDVDLEVS